MTLNRAAIDAAYSAVLSHVSATGQFQTINGHEPLSTPVLSGVAAAQWAAYLGPAIGSGLSQTSALLVLNVRVQSLATGDRLTLDAMDPRLLTATSAVLTRLIGDLTLGGTVRCIDVRGMSGKRLEANAGYMEQNKTMQRVMVITVPIIINDAWAEVA